MNARRLAQYIRAHRREVRARREGERLALRKRAQATTRAAKAASRQMHALRALRAGRTC
jgi:hypothetical protein